MHFANLRRLATFRDDHFNRVVVMSSDQAAAFLYTFKPGQSMPEHTHPFSDAYLSVVDGEAVITVGVESVLARPEDMVLVPREVVHAIHNHSSEPLVVVAFFSPKP